MQLKKIQIDRQNLLKYYNIILYSLLIINLKNENTPYIFFLQYAENTIFDPIVFWFSLGFFFYLDSFSSQHLRHIAHTWTMAVFALSSAIDPRDHINILAAKASQIQPDNHYLCLIY